MGTFTVSAMNFPQTPITQPYDFTLTGLLSVGDNPYSFDNTSLPMATISEANALATDSKELAASPSWAFFPDFFRTPITLMTRRGYHDRLADQPGDGVPRYRTAFRVLHQRFVHN
jgi:hypothetical protein